MTDTREILRKKYILTKVRVSAVKKIITWWRRYTTIKELKKIYNVLSAIPRDRIQQFFDMSSSIKKKFEKLPGGGLSSGTLIDMLISEFFNKIIPEEYKECREDENDLMISGIPLSFKKICGKSCIALDWSKNNNKSTRIYFNSHILILNLKSSKWRKDTDEIKSGFYIVDKKFCKYKIQLSNNNKTNTLITDKELYKMLRRSVNQNLFIPGTDITHNNIEFSLLSCFNTV